MNDLKIQHSIARGTGGGACVRVVPLYKWWKRKCEQWVASVLLRLLSDHAMQCILWKHEGALGAFVEANRRTRPLVYGSTARLHVDDTAVVNNASFNTMNGEITVGPYAFFGTEVCLLTGTHDIHKIDKERQESGGGVGRDIVIGRGVWLATRVMVIGPSVIGEHAVIGAGSVVMGDVEPGAFYAGIPARKIKTIDFCRSSAAAGGQEDGAHNEASEPGGPQDV